MQGTAPACPHCGREDHQVKAGSHAGEQRFKCTVCNRRYIPSAKRRAYPDDIRAVAINLREEGLTAREISERLGINPNSLAKWLQRSRIERRAAQSAPPAEPAEAAELPLKRRTTVFDVAEQAGVSISTISNYLNNRGRMSGETRERIKAAMADLSFTPNSLVRAIRQRRTHILGIVPFGMHELQASDNPTPALLSGINNAASSRGYNILIYTSPRFDSQETGLEFLDGHIDGLLWVAPRNQEPRLKTVVRAGLPTVALLASNAQNGAGFVAVDNVGGMRQMVAHLVSQGHRRIAYIGPNDTTDFLERIEGYCRGLIDAGLTVDPQLLATGRPITLNWYGTSRTEDYESAVDRWMKLPNPPTAIMLSMDGWAVWMIDHLHKLGLRVPEDIAVTGFDDAPSAQNTPGGITTVRQDFMETGRLGATLLMDLIDGASAESCRVRLPAELIVRGSTLKRTT